MSRHNRPHWWLFCVGVIFLTVGIISILRPEPMVISHPADKYVRNPSLREVPSARASQIYGALTACIGGLFCYLTFFPRR